MPHAASAGCTAPTGLDTPSVSTHTRSRESTSSTGLLLDVEADFVAAAAKSVSLVAPFTKRTCSLSLKDEITRLDLIQSNKSN